jgi:hypothetical protein
MMQDSILVCSPDPRIPHAALPIAGQAVVVVVSEETETSDVGLGQGALGG